MITLQEIFNRAWETFIVNDGKPSTVKVLNEVKCRYMTEDGRKCAVGLVLPDGHPAQHSLQDFPGIVRDFPEIFAPEIRGIAFQSPGRLERFQQCLHDHLVNAVGNWLYTKDEMKRRYRTIATDYELTIPGEG